MSTGSKTLQDEYRYIRRKGVLASINGSVSPIKKDNKNDFLHWSGCFMGPDNTPYENGFYYFEMKFTEDYPNKGPEVQMRTPIIHPNIFPSNGHICVSYLSSWSNTNNVAGIAMAIHNLLNDPSSKLDNSAFQKAVNFKNQYAHPVQNIDWDKSWNKGWTV